MGIARRSEPRAFAKSGGLHYQRVIPFPVADGVSIPSRIRILGKRPAVDPDRPPFVLALPEFQDASGGLLELERRGHHHDARKADGIALQDGIVSARRAADSVAGFF